MRDWVVKDDGHAVGDHHNQDNASVLGDEGVGALDSVVTGEGPSPAIGIRDNLDVAAVRLVAENKILQFCPKSGRCPAAVFLHVGRAISNMQAKVQAGVLAVSTR
jgi:hypothetical protein